MKTMTTTALVSTIGAIMFALPAAAAGPQATLVFQGSVPSVIPGGDHTITGPGGAPLPQGTLKVTLEGKVTTIKPVTFEVRPYTGGTAGTEAKPLYKVTLIDSVLTAGSATINNLKNVVKINDKTLEPHTPTEPIDKLQSSVTFTNEAGFAVIDVGTSGVVEARVVIIIEPPTADGG